MVKEAVWAKFAYTASDGKSYQVNFYNLEQEESLSPVEYHLLESIEKSHKLQKKERKKGKRRG